MSATDTTTNPSATREVDGQQVPVAGSYSLDPTHRHVGFSTRHLAVARVRGTFEDVSATIVVAEDPTASHVEATIGTASVDTGDEQRDGHLRSPDFFDVEEYPTMTYRSTSVQDQGDGEYAVAGELTVRDITRPVALDVTFEGGLIDPWGNPRIGISATAEINREDFGLTWNQTLETGGVLVGKKIKIEIEGEAVLES